MSDRGEAKPISVVGVPMDLGQSRRGVDMGPSALRYAGLIGRIAELGYDVHDQGNLETPVRDTLRGASGLGFLPAVVSACQAVYESGLRILEQGSVPLFLGGDHSIAIGTAGAASYYGRTGILWVDAHADFNTVESSPSGNIHGMPLAALTGLGATELVDLGHEGPKVAAQDVMLIGLRDLDPGEQIALRNSGAGVYSMREIDERGLARVAREAATRLSHLSRVHLSLDLDALDPSEASGVGTPVPGGLSYREAHLLMEIVADSVTITSIDVVEVNPILDQRNRTAELAVELLLSALGKTII